MLMKTFKDMYIAELQELVSVESQLDVALKRMADSAFASIAEAGAEPAPRRDQGAKQTSAIDLAEPRREIARAYRSGHGSADK